MPEVLKEGYLDVYDGIQSKVVSTTRFDENSDLSTAYLGRSDRAKCEKTRSRRSISHIRTGIYIRQVVRWNRVSIAIRYRHKQVIHGKILLYLL